MLQLSSVDSEIFKEGEGVLKPRFLKRFESFQLLCEFWLDQSWNILRPLSIFQLFIVVEVEIVQLPVVQFGVEDLSDQLVDVPHLPVYIFLKHAESLSSVKNLKSSHSSKDLH